MGSYDFEFLSNNLHIAYPFEEPAPLADLCGSSSSSSSGPLTDLGTVFADAVIYSSDLVSSRVRLKSLALTFNWPLPASEGSCVLAYESGGELVLDDADPEVTFRSEIYGRWLVVEWTLIDATPLPPPGIGQLTVRDVVCRFLLSVEALEAYDAIDLDLDSADAWLLSSVVGTGPRRVRRAFLKIGDYLFQLNDTLIVEPGFNMVIRQRQVGDPGYEPDEEDARGRKLVLVEATPGAGKGRYLRCLPEKYITTINGVPPDERGNLELAPEDCYWLEKPVVGGPWPAPPGSQVDEIAVVAPYSLRVHNACEECCSCEEYIKVYEDLNNIWALAKTVSARIYNVLEQYVELREALLAKGGDGQTNLTLTTRGQKGFAFNVDFFFVNGPDTIDINQTFKLVIEFTTTPGGFTGEYTENSGLYSAPGYNNQPIDPAGAWPTYELEFTELEMLPGATLLFTSLFRVKKDEERDRTGLVVKIKVTVYVDDVAVKSVTNIVKLQKPEKLD